MNGTHQIGNQMLFRWGGSPARQPWLLGSSQERHPNFPWGFSFLFLPLPPQRPSLLLLGPCRSAPGDSGTH